MHRFVLSALLLGLVWLCTATLGHSLPVVSNQAAQVFTQLQNQQSPYARLLTERTKRGLFSSLAGFASSGLAASAGSNKDPDSEDASLLKLKQKPKPYDFNEVEMTAIQAMISFRDIIGEILQKVGLNIPSLAHLITRSESDKASSASSLLSSESSSSPLSALTSTKSTNVGVQLLRGLALLSPLIIPMATQIRRMSPDTSSIAPSMQMQMFPQVPIIPDLYYNYNQATHRRRGKRSTNHHDNQKRASVMAVPALRGAAVQHMLSNRPILRYLRQIEARYAKSAK